MHITNRPKIIFSLIANRSRLLDRKSWDVSYARERAQRMAANGSAVNVFSKIPSFLYVTDNVVREVRT